jgi:hypothetical protein
VFAAAGTAASASARFGACAGVAVECGERPLSVYSGDVRRDARQRARRAGSSHFRAAESEAISGRVLRGRLDFLSRLFDQPIAKPSNRGLLHGLSCRDRIIRELQRPVHRQRLYQPL